MARVLHKCSPMRKVHIRVHSIALALSLIGIALALPHTSRAALTDAQRCAMGVEKEITNLQKCLGKVNLNIAKGRNVALPADDETCLAKFERGWERNRARYQATPAPACQAAIDTDSKRRVLAVNRLAAGRDLSLYPPLQGVELSHHHRNHGMPLVDWSPGQLRDLEDLPGGVIVRYE